MDDGACSEVPSFINRGIESSEKSECLEVRVMKYCFKRRLQTGKMVIGYSFSLPAVIVLFVFIFLPIAYCFYMSFYEWKLFDLGADKAFVGLDNYLRIFQDDIFGQALGNTIFIVISCIVIETILGFFIALTLWSMKRSLRVLQTIILLPMITAPVVVALVWRYIYDPQFGILNFILKNTIGIGDIAWLGDESTAIFSVIIVDIWQMTPFSILILFAAMMGISEDWIEAAQVDGAAFWQIVRKIIIPTIIPMLLFILLMRTMDLFKIFDTVYVLTKGGPGFSTETLSIYTYKVGFSQYEMGYAMALSMVILIGIMTISCFYMWRSSKLEE